MNTEEMKAMWGDDVHIIVLPRCIVCGPPCPFCGLTYGVQVAPDETAAEYMMGGRAENLTFWRDIGVDERELLISGTDPSCWARYIGSEDDGR